MYFLPFYLKFQNTPTLRLVFNHLRSFICSQLNSEKTLAYTIARRQHKNKKYPFFYHLVGFDVRSDKHGMYLIPFNISFISTSISGYIIKLQILISLLLSCVYFLVIANRKNTYVKGYVVVSVL